MPEPWQRVVTPPAGAGVEGTLARGVTDMVVERVVLLPQPEAVTVIVAVPEKEALQSKRPVD